MKLVSWSLITLIAAAPVGCAGSLDPNQDFFGNTNPLSNTSAKKDAGGNQSSDEDAGKLPVSNDAGNPPPVSNNNTDPVVQKDSGPPIEDMDSGAPVSTAGSSAPKVDAGPACDFRGLMQQKCGNASCHGAPATGTGLDLTSASLAARMEGRMGVGACSDKLMIDKDNPAESKLYLKVAGSSCGVKMPLGGTLTSDEVECVLSWIEGL